MRVLLLLLSLASVLTLSACNNAANSNSETPSPAVAPVSASASPEPMSHAGHGKPININTAILSELDKLEAKLGVPALSHRIQASRPYANTDELVSKKVITQEQFSQIQPMVTVEEVELTGEAKDVDYMTKMGLMKGHLWVARELVDLQKYAEAEPHIGHPVEEIYTDVEEQLQERKVPEFKTALMSLQDQVKAKSDPKQISPNLEASMKSVDNAIQVLPETQRKSPQFVLQVINGLLDTASSEYTAAIANNKIAEQIEYQDSRGFVLYAQSLYKEIAPTMAKEHADAHKTIETNFAQLLKAWPAVIPPATPVMSTDQVSQTIKGIEQASQKL